MFVYYYILKVNTQISVLWLPQSLLFYASNRVVHWNSTQIPIILVILGIEKVMAMTYERWVTLLHQDQQRQTLVRQHAVSTEHFNKGYHSFCFVLQSHLIHSHQCKNHEDESETQPKVLLLEERY